MSSFGALIKALDFAVAFNITFLLFRYIPALIEGARLVSRRARKSQETDDQAADDLYDAEVDPLTTIQAGRYSNLRRSYVKARTRAGVYATRLVSGIVVAFLGSWCLYVSLTYAFWHRDFDPSYSASPPPVRLLYLALTLLGTTIHICASYPNLPFWKAVGWWMSGLGLCVLALYLLEVGGLL